MKKVIIITLALLMALSLCACAADPGSAPTEPPVIDTQTAADEADGADAEASQTAGDQEVTDTAAPDDAGSAAENTVNAQFAEKFVTLLEDITDNYHPGTAGSSLTGARYAAEMADLFAEYKPDAAQVKEQIDLYVYQALDQDGEDMFREQMDGIAGSFEYISSDEGKGTLDDAGYESAGLEWDESVAELFASLLD